MHWRASIFLRMTIIVLVIVFSLVWHLRMEKGSSLLMLGQIGRPLVEYHCPPSGEVILSHRSLKLGDLIEKGEVLFKIHDRSLSLFKYELLKTVRLATSNLRHQLAKLEEIAIIENQESTQLLKVAQASLWQTRETRSKTEAELASLRQSLPKLKRLVRSGSSAQGEVALLVAKAEALKAVKNPLINQELAWQSLALSKASAGLKKTHEKVKLTLHNEIDLWENLKDEGMSLFEDLVQVKTSTKSAIASIKVYEDRQCQVGEPLIGLQPISNEVRLWWLEPNQLILPTKDVELLVLSNNVNTLQPLPVTPLFARLKSSAHTLSPLPAILQEKAANILGVKPLWGQAPLIYGVEVHGQILNDKTALPWGQTVLLVQ